MKVRRWIVSSHKQRFEIVNRSVKYISASCAAHTRRVYPRARLRGPTRWHGTARVCTYVRGKLRREIVKCSAASRVQARRGGGTARRGVVAIIRAQDNDESTTSTGDAVV
ncbi:hypothetical protein PUN28_004149 [Cardiocondyla obscurior]|uniref:Uncharacterized protein n=1 Tax=Cardiocondyla obscurior TaxID=286306 RepID=A0AAW2GPQ8_9HYME